MRQGHGVRRKLATPARGALCKPAPLLQTGEMNPDIASAVMPLLRLLDPETAHKIAVRALTYGLAGSANVRDDSRLAITALGRRFSNPIGLAAGFDKNAVALGGLARLGFGNIEAGTVTPRPQPGNPRPRLFRLDADRALINRMGFNNGGLEWFVSRIARRPHGAVVIGANVGINKDGANPERDYPLLVAGVAPYADYVVVNVSSPNTPGLRDLQGETRLRGILAAIEEFVPLHPPLLVKIAPDLSPEGLAAIVETAVALGCAGLIVANTTLARPPWLRSPAVVQPGGLSGRPLFGPSTRMLALAGRLARGRLVLFGVGGVTTGRDVLTKLRAGASVVQLYTEFAYRGPALIPRLKRELIEALDAGGYETAADAIGTGIEEILCAT
jgi:dihydroorotate dehydrogenase